MRAGLAVLAGIVAVACTAVSASPSVRKQDTGFRSRALAGRLRFEVYLPPGYDGSGLRYPVVYFLHGLPSSSDAYRTAGFVEHALDRLQSRAILVVPQGARGGESDPEYVDHGPGDAWETAIARELPHVVDARFRTIRSRAGRAVVGLSAGGYGAMHLALRHPGEFAVVESWSGYFHPTDPTGTKTLDLGSAQRNRRADVHRQVRAHSGRLRAAATYIAFYVGRDDDRFADENEQLNRELSRAHIPHVFRLYPGRHEQRLWTRHAPAWLALALAHLTAPRR